MKLILFDYSDVGVFIIGDVMFDCYWYGFIGCILLEVLVFVVKVENNEECLGGVANVVMNIVLFGGYVYIVGLIGIDELVRVLIEILIVLKVKCDFVVLLNYLIIIKLCVLSCG